MVWKKGESGNRSGRSSTQQRLYQTFYRHVYQTWLEHGPRCLEEMAINHPVEFVRLVAGLMPKQIQANITEDAKPASLEETIEELESVCGRLGLEVQSKKPLPHYQKEPPGTVIDTLPMKKVVVS